MLLNEKGSAMVVTLLVVMVLTLLGFSLWSYSMFEFRFTEREVNRTQAYYLARSGAESVAQHIIDDYNSDIVLKITEGEMITSNPTLLGDGSFTVTVSMVDDEVIIESTGEVNNIADSVTLILSDKEQTLNDIFNNAIFSGSDLDISHENARVFGDVESNGTITGNPNTGVKTENSLRNFSSPNMPDKEDLYQHPDISTNGTYTLNWDDYQDGIYVDNVDIGPAGKLIIEVPEDEVFIFKVHKYGNKGATEVVGGGIVILFVTHSAELQTPHTMTPDSFLVIMADGTVVTLRANGEFNGYINGPNATTIMQSKWSAVNGAIITGGMYGNLAEAKFMGTVTHEVREKLKSISIGEYIPMQLGFKKDRWER